MIVIERRRTAIVALLAIATLLFPLLGMVTGAPLLGWAKPVPVSTWRFERPRRDYLMVAAAGPLSNLALAFVAAVAFATIVAVVAGLVLAATALTRNRTRRIDAIIAHVGRIRLERSRRAIQKCPARIYVFCY